MKKALLIAGAIGVMGFYACKKDDKTITVNETVHDTIVNTIFPKGQVDPNKLSDAMTVISGTKVNDSLLPAASTDAAAPKLDPLYERAYQAIRGRYLFVTPPGISGTVAGYYFQIAGAKSYYKIAYTPVDPQRKSSQSAARFDDGFVDSTILVQLPVSIEGDTFTIRYAAYDFEGRVSNSLTALVTLLPSGSNAFMDSLAGTWNYYSYKYNNNSAPPRMAGAKIAADEEFTVDTLSSWSTDLYKCDGTSLVQDGNGTIMLYSSYGRRYKRKVFNASQFQERDSSSFYQIDLGISTCDKPAYRNSGYGYSNSYGNYAFDPATRALYFIYTGGTNLSTYRRVATIIELSANRLVLSYDNSTESDYLSIKTEVYTR